MGFIIFLIAAAFIVGLVLYKTNEDFRVAAGAALTVAAAAIAGWWDKIAGLFQ